MPCFDRRRIISSLSAALAASVLMGAAPSRAGRAVAITFDDLPFANSASHRTGLAEVTALNRKALDTLRKFEAPATGFVIEKTVEDYGRDASRAILKPWTEGGFTLGNHTWSHPDTNTLDLAAIEREVIDGEATIRPLMAATGKPLRFVRFPMNHTGDTLEKSLAIEDMLRRHGYVVAASTIDTSDYQFETAYEVALEGKDAAMAGRIADAYLAYTEIEIDYYSNLGRQVLGYEPREIAVLHLNRLNADNLEHILAIYVRKGFRFISLEEAQQDPAYVAPTTFATAYGPMWAYRWAKQKGVRVDGSLEQDPPPWIGQYAAGKPKP